MHVRRIACLILGIWLGGSLLMGIIATQSFRSADYLLQDPAPPVREVIDKLGGEGPARMFLRHYAGEQNRFYFEAWEIGQLALGLLLLGLLLFGTHEGKYLLAVVVLMTLLVAMMHWFVTPEIISLGRELDFTDPDHQPLLRQQLQSRHFLYSTLEGLKMLTGAAITFWLLRVPSKRKAPLLEDLNELPLRPVR